MSRLPLLLCAGWLACDVGPPRPGTSVGNPGKQVFRIAGAAGLEIGEARAPALTTDWIGCTEGFATVVAGEEVDLLHGAAIAVPGGRWCAVVLAFGAPIQISGQVPGVEGPSVQLSLEPPTPVTLYAATPIVVDEDEFVLELGAPGWLNVEALALEPGENIIEAGSDIAVVLTQHLVEDTALFEDPDGSGNLAEGERDRGPVAAVVFPPPPELAGEDTGQDRARIALDGCACGSSGGPWPFAAWWVAAILVLVRRRR